MKPGSFINPSTGVLPFEMFRSFSPVFDKTWPVTAWTPRCGIYETDKEMVLKVELPEVKCEAVEGNLVDAAKINAELKDGVLTVTLPKHGRKDRNEST